MTETLQENKMETANSKVVVVSAYGRGHGLAVRLKRLGIPTVLLDVSETLGSWVLEEAEGPFGIFQNENLEKSQMERLLEEDLPVPSANGFVLWLRDGPVELKGPLTKSRLRALGVEEENLAFAPNSSSSGVSGKEARALKKGEFSEHWLNMVSASFTSNIYQANELSLKTNKPNPWFSEFLLRYPSRPGHQKSMEWCARQGVEVFERTRVLDASRAEGRQIRVLEIQNLSSEKTQILNFDQLVWNLTSEETFMMSEKVGKILYPHGVLEPEWIWTRYRISVSEGLLRANIPSHCLMIRQVDEPWTHSNFMVVEKTASQEIFDVWVRLPNTQRFNKSYLEMRGEEILTTLKEKFLNLKIEIRSYPLGYELTYAQVGPAKQCIYSASQKANFRTGSFQNVCFDSIEQRSALGWNALFESEREVLNKLQIWWDKLQLKLKKQQGVNA